MKLYTVILFMATLFLGKNLRAQDLHFSQYFNAPMLLSPANAALMPESDYRVGANYRTQWGAIPVPFNTISAYGDVQFLRNKNETNWLGVGLAFFNDKAGAGSLALNKGQLMVAYHVMLDDANMLSVGLGAAYAQRSIDIEKLTFDVQWDGFRFKRDLVNGEGNANPKSSYMDISAGLNYAYFPNENLYIKFGAGLFHINRPQETLLRDKNNRLGLRPTGLLDALVKVSSSWIVNPSIYYTYQKAASELVCGIQASANVAPSANRPTSLYFGGYYRVKDAVIGLLGLEWNYLRLVGTYDFTVSSLSKANGSAGAFELSLSYQGLFSGNSINRNAYNCPRF